MMFRCSLSRYVSFPAFCTSSKRAVVHVERCILADIDCSALDWRIRCGPRACVMFCMGREQHWRAVGYLEYWRRTSVSKRPAKRDRSDRMGSQETTISDESNSCRERSCYRRSGHGYRVNLVSRRSYQVDGSGGESR